jgi:hypothetical protein
MSFTAFARPFLQHTNFYLINHTDYKNFHADIQYKNGVVRQTLVKCLFNLNKYVCATVVSDNYFSKGYIMKMAIVADNGCKSKFYTFEQLQLATLMVHPVAMPHAGCIFTRIKR